MTEEAERTQRPHGRAKVWLMSLGIFAGAVALFALLVATKKEPPQSERAEVAPLVEVTEVDRGPREIRLHAHGRAVAAREIVLQPEVSGRVIWHAPHLAPGGRFQKGEVMFKLDARDYRIAADARRADVSRAELELRIERGNQEVAKKEWETFGSDSPTAEANRDLALREPQVRAAEVALEAAKSSLDKASLDLQRTTVKAPFDGVVVSEDVGVGMVVGPQSQLGRFAATDEFWVTVSVPTNTLSRLRFPGDDAPGSSAEIHYRAGEDRGEIEGELVRLLPDLDPQGSMARLIARIPSPLDRVPPLLLGAYVSVAIEAAPFEDAAEIPRAALKEGDVVFIMNDEGRLEIRPVEVAWELPETLLVVDGLEAGERLVTSQLPTPLPGMLLRVAGDEGAAKLTRNGRGK